MHTIGGVCVMLSTEHINLAVSVIFPSLTLRQSYDCLDASESTKNDLFKYITHYSKEDFAATKQTATKPGSQFHCIHFHMSMAHVKTTASPLLTYWRYCSPAPRHRYIEELSMWLITSHTTVTSHGVSNQC